jgi:beta-lactamase regulating signal transducer with metallopeptidase domain
MIAPYWLRLACLCLAFFFVVNAALGLALSAASRRIIGRVEAMRPRSAAQLLFVLRLLPVVLGAAAVLALCVPSYLLLEPDAAPERVGIACLILALLGAFVWLASFTRASRAVLVSLRCHRSWQQAGVKKAEQLIVDSDAPLLAVAGVFRPQIVISEGVLQALSADQLHVALLHENAHRSSRDNLKRLVLLLSPDLFPFLSPFSLLEQSWAKFREWAADEEAAQGDSERALSLASALLEVARLGRGPRLPFLHTSLVAGDHDLSERVERLLHLEGPRPAPPTLGPFYGAAASILAATSLAALVFWPATLSSVHRLLEQFLR